MWGVIAFERAKTLLRDTTHDNHIDSCNVCYRAPDYGICLIYLLFATTQKPDNLFIHRENNTTTHLHQYLIEALKTYLLATYH